MGVGPHAQACSRHCAQTGGPGGDCTDLSHRGQDLGGLEDDFQPELTPVLSFFPDSGQQGPTGEVVGPASPSRRSRGGEYRTVASEPGVGQVPAWGPGERGPVRQPSAVCPS